MRTSYSRVLNRAESLTSAWWLRRRRAFALQPEEAAGFRLAYGSFLLLCYLPHYTWLAGLPEPLYDPLILSPASGLTSWPGEAVLRALDIALPLAAAALALGIRARVAGLATGILLCIGWTLESAAGKVDHYALLGFVPMVMALGNWGCEYALLPDRRVERAGIPQTVLAICIAFAMFSAGVGKLRVWLDLDTTTSGFINWFYSGWFRFERRPLLGEYVFGLPGWMLEVMDYAAVAFEISGVLLLFYSARRFAGIYSRR